MINRNNFALAKEFENWHKRHYPSACHNLWSHLVLLLQWLGENGLKDMSRIKPNFPEFLVSARRDGKKEPISYEYTRHVLATARKFLHWVRTNQSQYQKCISPDWLKELKPSQELPKKVARSVVSLNDILDYVRAPAKTTLEKRTRSTMALLYLTGIRVDTAMTLPLANIDLQNGEIRQGPEHGCRTKRGKSAVTRFLPRCGELEPVWAVVVEWINLLQTQPIQPDLWFAPLSLATGEIDAHQSVASSNRDSGFRADISTFCKKSGLKYHTPHAFRRGHGHYIMNANRDRPYLARQFAKNNLMHDDIATTEIYIEPTNEELKETFELLFAKKSTSNLAGPTNNSQIILNIDLANPENATALQHLLTALSRGER